MAHALGTLALVWCFIGSALLVILDGTGGIAYRVQARRAAGKTPSLFSIVGAGVLAIVAWPLVARRLLQDPHRAFELLARNFWRRR